MNAEYLPEAEFLPHIRIARLFDTQAQSIHAQTPQRRVDCYELSYLLSGSGSLCIDGTDYPVRPWSVRFTRPGQVICSIPPFRCYTVFFDLDAGQVCRNEMLDVLPEFFHAGESCQYLFEQLVHAFVTQEPGSIVLANALLMQLLAGFCQQKRQTEHYCLATRQCIDYIQAHLSEKITLETLGEHTGYSALHVLRLFKKDTGQSPHDYINALQITRARQLLAETDMPVHLIAAQCGFSSETYFYTFFKNAAGTTPNEYRSNALLF